MLKARSPSHWLKCKARFGLFSNSYLAEQATCGARRPPSSREDDGTAAAEEAVEEPLASFPVGATTWQSCAGRDTTIAGFRVLYEAQRRLAGTLQFRGSCIPGEERIRPCLFWG